MQIIDICIKCLGKDKLPKKGHIGAKKIKIKGKCKNQVEF